MKKQGTCGSQLTNVSVFKLHSITINGIQSHNLNSYAIGIEVYRDRKLKSYDQGKYGTKIISII